MATQEVFLGFTLKMDDLASSYLPLHLHSFTFKYSPINPFLSSMFNHLKPFFAFHQSSKNALPVRESNREIRMLTPKSKLPLSFAFSSGCALGRSLYLSLGLGLGLGLNLAYTQESQAATAQYQPQAQFDLTVTEMTYRQNPQGRNLMARIYRPNGEGPFPVIVDFHGGAWNAKDRHAEEPMDRALAKSGLLVVAVDLTLAPQAPFPANMQDAHYAVRWAKLNAAKFAGDASKIGIYGSSSGGHVAELLQMKPDEPTWGNVPLQGHPEIDARVQFVVARSAISDPQARYDNAVQKKRDNMIKNNTTYFQPWSSIDIANPQHILDRHEAVRLVPIFLMQGELDDNVLPSIQVRFCESYKAAGGECTLQIFAGSEHEWVAKEGEQTDLARARAKAYIAQHVNP